MQQSYQWAVIGAGPAGIATVGQLIHHQVDPKHILWIDPYFAVGDFGRTWRQVSSNTKVDLFLKFFNHCQAFNYAKRPDLFEIDQIDPDATCQLRYAAKALQWITEQLCQQVVTQTGWLADIKESPQGWQLTVDSDQFTAQNVVLAQGAEPKTLTAYQSTPILPLDVALDAIKLKQHVNNQDIVAVFGASHSGIITLRLLLEAGVKQVINFYQGSLRYAVPMDDWTLFDNTGLKGETAQWAKAHLHGTLPQRLLRVPSNEANVQQYLPQCTKAVHAVGFTPRSITITGLQMQHYNRKSGIIAPGLFGVGIAFPEETIDRFGNVELSVGLWKFMTYLERIMPVWLRYGY